MIATISGSLTMRHSGTIIRPLTSLVIALFVTVFLFWVMQYLIETADHSLDHEASSAVFEFVRLVRDETVNDDRIKKPEALPKPEKQPPQPQTPRLHDSNATVLKVSVAPVTVDPKVNFTEGYNLGSEGDYLPVVKVAPIYPNRALSRGVEGFCVVEYTVTRLGTIKDPVVVSDQCSSTLFHTSSINAAFKFKYKPRVVSGVEVEVSGVRNKFTYRIEE